MRKIIVSCKGCGYTWYPDKEKWEGNPDAPEPSCPNKDCKHYGTGFRPVGAECIWEHKGDLNLK